MCLWDGSVVKRMCRSISSTCIRQVTHDSVTPAPAVLDISGLLQHMSVCTCTYIIFFKEKSFKIELILKTEKIGYCRAQENDGSGHSLSVSQRECFLTAYVHLFLWYWGSNSGLACARQVLYHWATSIVCQDVYLSVCLCEILRQGLVALAGLVFLCSSGWLWTQSNLSASVSRILGL